MLSFLEVTLFLDTLIFIWLSYCLTGVLFLFSCFVLPTLTNALPQLLLIHKQVPLVPDALTFFVQYLQPCQTLSVWILL